MIYCGYATNWKAISISFLWMIWRVKNNESRASWRYTTATSLHYSGELRAVAKKNLSGLSMPTTKNLRSTLIRREVRTNKKSKHVFAISRMSEKTSERRSRHIRLSLSALTTAKLNMWETFSPLTANIANIKIWRSSCRDCKRSCADWWLAWSTIRYYVLNFNH
jgi:hypothetical protein